MVEQRIAAKEAQDLLAAPVHLRLYFGQPKKTRIIRGGQIEEIPLGSSARKPLTSGSQPTFHPSISEGTKQIMERKQRGKRVEESLLKDAKTRKQRLTLAGSPNATQRFKSPVGPSSSATPSSSSQGLLLKRFEEDFSLILEQFEILEDSFISEVTMTSVMLHLGLV